MYSHQQFASLAVDFGFRLLCISSVSIEETMNIRNRDLQVARLWKKKINAYFSHMKIINSHLTLYCSTYTECKHEMIVAHARHKQLSNHYFVYLIVDSMCI